MIRLTHDDSPARVDDASERFMHLCSRCINGSKYLNLIKPFKDDFDAKKRAFEVAARASVFAGDVIKLTNSSLDDVLRDVHGRAEEFDRKNIGSDITELLFPGGLSAVIYENDREEPIDAHAVAVKIISLGATHVLNPFPALIETEIEACNDAFDELLDAQQAEGDANTALTVSKVKLVNQYNTIYHIAATDYGKSFAEKLYPQLRSPKKDIPTGTNNA